jgi:gamma-glutamylputrescine oxidase
MSGSEHVDSYYAASASPLPRWLRFEGEARCDVCVIGGGFMGLSTALHLAGRGYRVLLLEGRRIGWGASGRNGGQCSIGPRLAQDELEDMLGVDTARLLWRYSLDAVALVRELIERFDIACDLKRGKLETAWKTSDAGWYRAYADKLRHDYELDCRYVEGEDLRQLCGTDVFRGGLVEYESAHLHPLKYALGLARAAEAQGAVLHEDSMVQSYGGDGPTRIVTAGGVVTADHVVLACNGYLERLEPRAAGRIMPINNFVLTTAPLDEARRQQLNPEDLCMHDSRFVVNYWKLTGDGRMLFGGGENYTRRFPTDLKRFVRRYLLDIYPQLADTDIDYAWGGTLAVTRNRLPCLGRLPTNVWYAMGFSGQGVQTATLSGQLIAEAIAGTAERFDVLARLPTPQFPGGTLLRWPGLVLGMLYYTLRDRIGD